MPEFIRDLIINVALTTPLVGAYIMFALGIVFIYRASKVLNLAHGAMAMVPAYVAFAVGEQAGLGVVAAVVAAAASGAGIGVVVERGVVRRLRPGGATAQTVGTVGVFGLLIALAVRGWGTLPRRGVDVFPSRTYEIGGGLLQLGDIGLLVTALGLAVLVLALFRYTHLGLAMRCAADNQRAARLMGIDPDRTTAVAWLLAGLLAGLGGVLLGSSTNLHPFTLSLQVLPAFVAALIGGLESLPGAIIGSAVVGLTIGIVPTFGGIGAEAGAPEVALTAVAMVVMALRGKRFSVAEPGGGLS